MPEIDSTRIVLPAGIIEAAARSTAELYDSCRKLPDKPIRLIIQPPRIDNIAPDTATATVALRQPITGLPP
jgi:hypothetical protein